MLPGRKVRRTPGWLKLCRNVVGCVFLNRCVMTLLCALVLVAVAKVVSGMFSVCPSLFMCRQLGWKLRFYRSM